VPSSHVAGVGGGKLRYILFRTVIVVVSFQSQFLEKNLLYIAKHSPVNFLKESCNDAGNMVDKKDTVIYLTEYFHFPSQCHSTNVPHSHSLT